MGEALLALEAIKETGLPAVINLAIFRDPHTREDLTPAEACKRLEDAGADVVGLNCVRGPATMLPLLEAIREAVSCHVSALPVAYRTTKDEPTFLSLSDPGCACLPEGRAFPTGLDNLACNRYEIAEFTKEARGARCELLWCLLRRGAPPHPQHGGGARPPAAGEQVLAGHVPATPIWARSRKFRRQIKSLRKVFSAR